MPLGLAASSSRQCATSQLLSSSFCIFGHRPSIRSRVSSRREREREGERREEEVILIVSFGHPTLGGPARVRRRRRYCRRRSHSFVRLRGRSVGRCIVCVPPSLPPGPGRSRPCPACLVTRLCAQIDVSSCSVCSDALRFVVKRGRWMKGCRRMMITIEEL